MAPRPNSGLETHEEEIIGDSPTLEPYLHHANVTAGELTSLMGFILAVVFISFDVWFSVPHVACHDSSKTIADVT